MSKQPVTSFDIQELASRLVAERKSSKLSRDEVVELSTSGFARSSLQEWEGGKREPKLEYIYDLARIYGVSPWKLLSGRDEPNTDLTKSDTSEPPTIYDGEYVLIPAYDIEASAGHGCFTENENPSKRLAFRKRWIEARGLNADDLAIIFTRGDSMEPTIPDGSALMVDTSKNQPVEGKISVINLGRHLVVKRVQIVKNSCVRLISDNKEHYEPQDYTPEEIEAENFRICGHVVHISYDLD